MLNSFVTFDELRVLGYSLENWWAVLVCRRPGGWSVEIDHNLENTAEEHSAMSQSVGTVADPALDAARPHFVIIWTEMNRNDYQLYHLKTNQKEKQVF